MQIINIIAVLLSPVVALLISIFIQNRSAKRKSKMEIFNTLLATRHNVYIVDETVRAFNMIDVVFYDKPKIRSLWREYYSILGLAVPNAKAQ